MSTSKIITIGFILIILGMIFTISFPIDSTDISKTDRSGMRLYIDNLTGCHYLAPFLGGLTPRLDGNGDQICTGHE